MYGSKRFLTAASWRSRAHRAWFMLCSVCLALYIAYIAFLGGSALFEDAAQTVAALCSYLAYAIVIWALLLYAVQRLKNAAPKAGERRRGKDVRLFLLLMGLSMLLLGFTFLRYYPGGVSYDAANQWRQAQSGQFNNWHPVFHTLLIWLVTRISESYSFAVLVQLAAFSAALAYLMAALEHNGAPKWLVITVECVVALSEPVGNALMYLWKDNAMTVGCLALCAQCARMLFSRGEWLEKPRNAVCFGLALAFTTMVRHNAVLFTLPLLLLVLGCYGAKRRSVLTAAGTLLACLLLVQGALMGALDVVYPNNTAEEAVGIPMAILGNAMQTKPEALDSETKAFLRTLAPDEGWKTVYRRSDYNSIKFTFPRELVRDTPATDILGMALRTAVQAPRLAFETVNEVTDLVWDVTGQNEGYETVSNSGDLDKVRVGRGRLNAVGAAVSAFLKAPLDFLPLRWLTQNIGVQMLLLLLVTLWALYRRGVEALFFAVPTLCYNLATMLLLCGQDARFFQFTMAISLPAIVALLYAPATVGQEPAAKTMQPVAR